MNTSIESIDSIPLQSFMLKIMRNIICKKVITDSKSNYGRVKMEIHIMKKITEFPTLCKLEKGRKLDELTCTVFV
jgi:hypothetical protein